MFEISEVKMMPEGIIVALIGLIGSGIGSVFGILTSNKLIIYRIGELEKKVNLYNNLIERNFELEKQESILEEKINVINEHINKIKDEN